MSDALSDFGLTTRTRTVRDRAEALRLTLQKKQVSVNIGQHRKQSTLRWHLVDGSGSIVASFPSIPSIEAFLDGLAGRAWAVR